MHHWLCSIHLIRRKCFHFEKKSNEDVWRKACLTSTSSWQLWSRISYYVMDSLVTHSYFAQFEFEFLVWVRVSCSSQVPCLSRVWVWVSWSVWVYCLSSSFLFEFLVPVQVRVSCLSSSFSFEFEFIVWVWVWVSCLSSSSNLFLQFWVWVWVSCLSLSSSFFLQFEFGPVSIYLQVLVRNIFYVQFWRETQTSE